MWDIIECNAPIIFGVLVFVVVVLCFLLSDYVWLVVFPALAFAVYLIVTQTRDPQKNIYVKGIDYLD